MTPKLVDDYEYLNRRLKEIEEEKEKARNREDTEKPQEPENHEWSLVPIDNIYPG